jgi:tRNA (guanine10-N2)-dimethyltransferase
LFARPLYMDAPTRVFVVLSGEHPTLPMAEMKAILDANHIEFRILDSFYKLTEIEADLGAVKKIAGRGAFIDEVGTEIIHTGTTIPEIDDALKTSNLQQHINPDESFSIRVHRFGGVSKETSSVKLEGHLGWLIGKLTGARVDLENPQTVFRGLLAGPLFHLGVVEHTRPADFVGSRRPRKRPAFHPSTMTPKLARSMVNLSGAIEGTVFLDPFCGVGGILLEASLLGCHVVGTDALRRMVRGSRRNLKHFGMNSLGLIRGDARKIPVRNVEAIATDPPYGTGASTLKSTTRTILEDFLPEARSSLGERARLVVASPKGTGTPEIADSAGFTIVGSHDVYVHRRLTREILVLEAD